MWNSVKEKRRAFLHKLANLCDEYNITEIGYTTDDDGVHIKMDGKDIYIGYIIGRPSYELRKKARGE